MTRRRFTLARTTRILLDIDGVLNKLPVAALKKYGYKGNEYPCPGEYDIAKVAKKTMGWVGRPANFWSGLSRTFWKRVPPSDEKDWLINACKMCVGDMNVFLCTAPVYRNEACLLGKLDWIQKHIPQWLQNRIIITSTKEVCANPNTLLIDDYDLNIERFRYCGGRGFLVPKLWNSLHNIARPGNIEQLLMEELSL